MKRCLAIAAVLVLLAAVVSSSEEKESEVNFPDPSLKQSDRLMICLSDLCRRNCENQNKFGICEDGNCKCI
ncbi:unnamed protein product [Callosobruchus maculatus]|uniref:Invertebrate defensins family profile domain-containing protein n=1 Tax=Callosobruchus maculatus TaxID=64391 RepID=A0A653C2G0_CALMS|nr:unnamed protein product [Callosobruchus maculatus]